VGGQRRMHNEKFHNFTKYYYSDQINYNKMEKTCSTLGKDEKYIYIFCQKTLGKRPLGRFRHRCWVLVDMVMDLQVP